VGANIVVSMDLLAIIIGVAAFGILLLLIEGADRV
jgi:hypothetical protein